MTRPDAPSLTATYRLQLHEKFPLARAREIAGYLARLGVSHLYVSPITMARPGSMHGYDVADPTRVNPELGGEPALDALVAELRRLGLGLIVDIVPNHMGIGPANPMWEDLLARGRASAFAHWFDVDWDAPAGDDAGRVLLPVLAERLEAVLARDEVSLVREQGALRVKYFDHSFPTDPATVGEVPDDPAPWTRGEAGRARLRALLDRQHYRLAHWRRAAGEINYRRFFDVNELAGLRQEDPEVFRATHERILSWVARGLVQGLRVDHVDGLRQPRAYLEQLRAAVRERGAGDDFPIFVEKILSPGERLRGEWSTDGTTGYEFLNDLEALFIDASGAARLEASYRRHTRLPAHLDFAETARRGKRAVLHGALAADVARLARLLAPALRDAMRDAGVSRDDLKAAIVAFIVACPVYRTYAEGAEPRHPDDRAVLDRALARAREQGDAPGDALVLLHRVLTGDEAPHDSRVIDFVLRFQQVSGPATAKGVEDTALYRYVPLASRNEVGGHPDRDLSGAPGALHRANAERASRWPRALVCTNTHDTKRSADVRARLDVLTEIPEQWAQQVSAWHRLNAPLRGRSQRRRVPDASAEWLLYQTLLGLWPTGGAVPDASALGALGERVRQYMEKANREAKARTSWTDPDTAWEEGMGAFVTALLDPARSARFIGEMDGIARQVAAPAAWNAVARALVHLTAPGTPDIYQGDELWNHALVDPDNRRPVDYAAREQALASLEAGSSGDGAGMTASLLANIADGRLKMHVMRSALRLRRERPATFLAGRYEPIVARGARASHLFGFVRGDVGSRVVVAVPRLTVALSGGRAPLGDCWGDTAFALPGGQRWVDRLTGATVPSHDGGMHAGSLFATLPLALLVEEGSPQPGR